MFKIILWDIDGTILDFKAAEKVALKNTISELGIGECNDDQVAVYSEINNKYWKMLERGEISKPDLLNERFKEFFTKEGFIYNDFEKFNKIYQVKLGDTIVFNDESYSLLKSLKGKYKQYAVTNGTFLAQDIKLKKSGLYDIFDQVFISEKVGYEKPDIKFFEKVFKTTEISNKNEVIIIGDSLTGDMKGGENAGIATCWYNPLNLKKPENPKIDYVISDLNEINNIL